MAEASLKYTIGIQNIDKVRRTIGCAVIAMLLMGCKSGQAEKAAVAEMQEDIIPVDAPQFNADSAYMYVSRQVDFGPRVPGSASHVSAGKWLVSELRRHGATVTEQRATLTAFNGDKLPMLNIIGSYNPQSTSRTLLVAHWDTRPWADKDPELSNRTKPLKGANDGASGVGVLLEVARLIAAQNPGIGVDILFSDCEDYGEENGGEDTWCLGTQYYANSIANENHNIERVILLDMVGGRNASFSREGFSETDAPELNAEFWSMAHAGGYGELFPNIVRGQITDDHLPFLELGIPAIDIIDNGGAYGLPDYHHTMADDMGIIDRSTLKAVGQTLTNYVYSLKNRK